MIREIIKIDEKKCNGCGNCVPNCHEGALQIIEGKARLISELMCDGLGACIGHCPEGAITIEKREAEAYDEKAVMAQMAKNGKNVVTAHLKHLKEHNETEYLEQAFQYLKSNENNLSFTIKEIQNEIHGKDKIQEEPLACGCPGSHARSFDVPVGLKIDNQYEQPVSQLTHWPVQLHLINPAASYFSDADLLIAADCTAFASGNFHNDFLKGRKLIIACPKLDHGTEIYLEKIRNLIDVSHVNTITVLIMEVPCCAGLVRLASLAVSNASRKVPVKEIIISVKGVIISEKWI